MTNITKLTKVCLVAMLLMGASSNLVLAQTKSDIINMAYFASFGRFANASEYKAWYSSSSCNTATIMASNRNYLRTNAYEKSQTLQRAFIDVSGGAPTQQDINAYAVVYKIYAELMTDIWGTIKNSPGRRLSVITAAFLKALGRSPTSAEFAYWSSQPFSSYNQLVGYLITTKTKNAGSVAVNSGFILGGINSNGISTLSLTQTTLSSLVASGAGNLVASGAGNIVASGAGNLVASGAGN